MLWPGPFCFIKKGHATLITYSLAPIPQKNFMLVYAVAPFHFAPTKKSPTLLVYAVARPLLVSPKRTHHFDNLFSVPLYRKKHSFQYMRWPLSLSYFHRQGKVHFVSLCCGPASFCFTKPLPRKIHFVCSAPFPFRL